MSQHQPTSPDPVAQAITALTTAARGRRTIGAGTPHEHTEPVDFADIAAHVLTAVAANLGGVEQLLAGRPGSWETEHVRQLVEGTAGPEEKDLLAYRTEPLRLELDVDQVFSEFGVYDLHGEACEELAQRLDTALDAMFDTVGTPEERARRAKLRARLQQFWEDPAGRDGYVAADDELRALNEAIVRRAQAAGDPHAATLADDDAEDQALHRLWEQDQAAYRQGYAAAVREALAARGIEVPVELVDPTTGPDAPKDQGPLIEELHAHALKAAPLPMTGQAPDWTQGTPADALRRAGLTYTARIRQSH